MRSANLIGQEMSSDRIDLYFIFQWTRSVFMRGRAIPRGPFTTELLLWYCTMLLWREMDSLQLLILYLTLTPIFSGRKANINLHTMPKLTVLSHVDQLSAASIQFPSPQSDAITSCTCACFSATCLFSVEPRNKIVSWTWLIQHVLQFVFAFFNHSIKIAQFLFAGGHFFSITSHFDRWCFSSPMETNDVISYLKPFFLRFTEVWNVVLITSNFSMKTFGFHAS